MVSFLCALTKPVGHIITGVQKTIFLSFKITLLCLSGAFAAADDIDPVRRLLVSLMTESSLLLLLKICAGTYCLVVDFGGITIN